MFLNKGAAGTLTSSPQVYLTLRDGHFSLYTTIGIDGSQQARHRPQVFSRLPALHRNAPAGVFSLLAQTALTGSP